MKKYSFRLETVRRVRRTREELAKSALAKANGDVQRAIAAVESKLEAYEQHSSTSSRLGTTGVDAFMKQRYFNELAGRAVVAARIDQQAVEQQADIRRSEWSTAAQQVKALDRLDDRRRQEHRVEADREVDKIVDDIIVARAAGTKSA